MIKCGNFRMENSIDMQFRFFFIGVYKDVYVIFGGRVVVDMMYI